MFYVYHITKNETHIGYVGVSNDPKTRWIYHKNNDYPVGRAIRKYDLQYDRNLRIVFSGSEEECYTVEAILRPRPNMGYNVAAGGIGGFGKWHKGKPKSPKHIQKLKDNSVGKYDGANNPRAKEWILWGPNGETYRVNGNLQSICDTLNLTRATLIKHLGTPVPDTSRKGSGGYRKVSEDLHTKRLNTIGWTLTEKEQ